MKIAVLIDDLFFSSKISATAQHVGSEVVLCRTAEGVPPDAARICVDLNASTFDPIEEIRKLKAGHSRPIVAFLSHVQVDLKRKAEEAGADEVMPRSAFAQRLPEILGKMGS
ncbi:MAG: response regulator [Acidobacteria bacterium]|nr:MAG: response regulator [Acidobacteriota bacterium]